MNILLTTTFEYPHTGGLSAHVETLEKALRDLGHRVEVLSISNTSRWRLWLLVKGPSFLLNLFHRGAGMIWSHILRRRALSRLLRRKVAEGSVDVINAQDVFSALAATKLPVPVVLTVHGYFTYEAISRKKLKQESLPERYFLKREKEAYRKVNQIITVDTRLGTYVENLTGRSTGVRVIRNFVDTSLFEPTTSERKIALRREKGLEPDGIVLLCPRRLTRKNGVLYPLLAVQRLKTHFRRLVLLYAGAGEEWSRLRDVVARSGLVAEVRFLGSVPRKQMGDWYGVADIVLIPSIHSVGVEEATSVAALEAMASGVPVVASAVGGLRELIQDRETGLLVPEKDPNALARAVRKLISDLPLREGISRNARAYVERQHSLATAPQKLVRAYLEAMGS